MRRQKMMVMESPTLLEDNAVYTLDVATLALGLAKLSLPREVRKGRMRVSRRCGRYVTT